MKKIVNLVSFNLKTYVFDIECICKETNAEIRYLGMPYHDNDATMYHFFRNAYPSQFQNVEFSEMGKYLKSDAKSSRGYYIRASWLSYQNACYIPNNSICENTEKEAQQILSKIYEWLEPHALTLIDFPRSVADDRKISVYENIVHQMAGQYNCTVINYVPYFEKEHQLEKSKEKGLQVPCICWKGVRDYKAKTLLEQVQQDERIYQSYIIGFINGR